MKIVITGTHSTGKTTLAKKISEICGLPFIRGDKAVMICREYFPDRAIETLSLEEQVQLQKMMFQGFNEALEYNGDCVTDGFHLTCLPYGIKYTNGKIAQTNDYSKFVQEVMDKSKQFDKIFYLPPEILLENDDFRPLDEALRLEIDKILLLLLKKFSYHVLSGSIEDRVRQVKELI